MATITAAAGGGNWTAGATWVGGVAPSSADDAVLNGTSGAVTINTGAVCRSLDCTGYAGTLTHTAAVTLTIGDGTAGAGLSALRLAAGMTYTLGNATTSAISFVSTSTTQQAITFGGKTTGNLTFNGAGGSWQFQDNLTAASVTVTLTSGTLDTNGKAISISSFQSTNTNTRTLTLGASNITCASSATAWSFQNATSLTFNANTSVITVTGTGPTFQGGSQTFNTVNFNTSGGAVTTVGGANTFATLSITGSLSKIGSLNFSANNTITGTLTINGNSITNRTLINSSTLGTARTLTASVVSLSNVDFQDITGAGGAAPFSGTSLGDCQGNSGIAFTAAVTRFYVGGAGNWSDTTHWSASSGGVSGASVPLSQDTVNIDGNSGTGIITADMPRLGKDVSFSGYGGTAAFSSVPNSLFGNLTLGSGMTVSGTQILSLGGRGAQTVTSAGKTFTQAVTLLAPGGTYSFADVFNTAGTLTVTNGTLSASTFNVTCGTLSSSNSNLRGITMGSGTWSLTGTGTVWNTATATNLTLTAGTSTILMSDISATAKTFTGGGKAYNNLTIATGGTGSVTFSGGSSFNNMSVSGGSTKSIIFTAGTTTTITGSFFSGAPGNLITITSSTPGTAATVSRASGIVSSDYLSLQDSAAAGGANWYAGANSSNVSGNSGWIFTAPPTGGSNTAFFAFFN